MKVWYIAFIINLFLHILKLPIAFLKLYFSVMTFLFFSCSEMLFLTLTYAEKVRNKTFVPEKKIYMYIYTYTSMTVKGNKCVYFEIWLLLRYEQLITFLFLFHRDIFTFFIRIRNKK